MPKENNSQTIGLKLGLPNSTNNGIDIKAGILDSNSNCSQNYNHKIYDYSDKNKGIATVQSLKFCIDCSILESCFLTSVNAIRNETNEIFFDNATKNINANPFSYQDSAIKAQETINDDGTSTLTIESKQDIFAYQGNTADSLMSGISGIFSSIDKGLEKAMEMFGGNGLRFAKLVFKAEDFFVSFAYNYNTNEKDIVKALVSIGAVSIAGSVIAKSIIVTFGVVTAPKLIAIGAISAILAGILLNTNAGKSVVDWVTDNMRFFINFTECKLQEFFTKFDSNPSAYELVENPTLTEQDYQSLIELLLHKDSNANDIDALLRTFPNYLVNPANQNNKNDSIKSNIATSNASNAICMNIKAQCFNHKNEILANKEIYVYSPNFNAFVDRAKSDNNGFIEFNNACVSSKMTNSDLYFVLNRYGLDEEQKDFHIKISPFKTIQPKDKKVKQLIGQKLIFDKHIPKAIKSNEAITPNIKVISIEFIQDNQTNSPPNNNAFDNSQKSKYFITLKANYDIRDSQKKHIKGDKDKYLNDSIVMHQHKTQWGYIVFDKDEDIDKSLMEITKTTPLIYSKKFKRLDNIKGQRVRLPFRDEWEDKQVRFFAYLWRPSKNVGIDVEIREINYVVIYNENIEQKSFFDNITWQDVAIEIILLHPIVRGVNVIFKFGKWGLSFLGKTKINQKVAKQYSQKKIVIKKSKKAKSKTNNISEVKLNSLPKDTQEAYYGYKRHKWQGKYPDQDINAKNPSAIRANGAFHNGDNLLPEKLTTSKGYKEYDVVNKYDPRRFVRDIENGDIYYTTDHYKTFVKIIE